MPFCQAGWSEGTSLSSRSQIKHEQWEVSELFKELLQLWKSFHVDHGVLCPKHSELFSKCWQFQKCFSNKTYFKSMLLCRTATENFFFKVSINIGTHCQLKGEKVLKLSCRVEFLLTLSIEESYKWLIYVTLERPYAQAMWNLPRGHGVEGKQNLSEEPEDAGSNLPWLCPAHITINWPVHLGTWWLSRALFYFPEGQLIRGSCGAFAVLLWVYLFVLIFLSRKTRNFLILKTWNTYSTLSL